MTKRYVSGLGDLADPSRRPEELNLQGVKQETLCSYLEAMLLIRTAEEAIAELSSSEQAGTPCHLGIGQEAIAAGVCAELGSKDRLFGTHRAHSQFLALGGDIDELMAEVLGKATGCSKGMGGSMHLTGRDFGFWGSVPIVAATIPVAVGAGMAAKMDGEDAVGVCFFGDGAVEEGGFHESLNFASTYDLPVIFVCENNLYSSHLDIALRQPNDRTARFAKAHHINEEVVDGNNVIEVGAATRRLLEKIRDGRGPGYLEAVTYRWRGHVGPSEDVDVGVRRKPEDLELWKRRDPVARLYRAMADSGMIDQNAFEEMQQNVFERVQTAVKRAQDAPYPEESALLDLVYSGN